MADTLMTAPTPVEPVTPPSPNGTPAAPAVAPTPSAPADWRASLPTDLQAHKGLEKFKDPVALTRAYVELEKYQGRSVAIPGADAKPEEVAAFWTKVGAPDAPDKYTVSAPEGATVNTEMLAPFQAAAHAAHLTQDQWAAMVSAYQASVLGNPALASEQLATQAVTQLRGEWGGAFDYNIKTAKGGVGYAERMSGAAGLRDFLHDTGLGNHPVMVKLFHWIGKTNAESGGIPTDAKMGGVLSPDQAQQKINELMATPEYRRGDREAVDRVQELFQLKLSG